MCKTSVVKSRPDGDGPNEDSPYAVATLTAAPGTGGDIVNVDDERLTRSNR